MAVAPFALRDIALLGAHHVRTVPSRLDELITLYYRCGRVSPSQQFFAHASGLQQSIDDFSESIDPVAWKPYRPLQPGPWLCWHHRDVPEPRFSRPQRKLYIEFHWTAAACALDVVAKSVSAFASAGVSALKVPSTPRGFLRPDKLIVYVDQSDVSPSLLQLITSRTCDLPAHETPFVSRVPGTKNLGSGVDNYLQDLSMSWREWIAKELAVATIEDANEMAPIDVDRLLRRFEGRLGAFDVHVPSFRHRSPSTQDIANG